MSGRDDALLPQIRRDTRVRVVVSGGYLLCAIWGAVMFGAGGTLEDHGWAQLVEDLGTAFADEPLIHLGCLAAMVLGLLWPRTPVVLIGFVGAFFVPFVAGIMHGIRIT